MKLRREVEAEVVAMESSVFRGQVVPPAWRRSRKADV